MTMGDRRVTGTHNQKSAATTRQPMRHLVLALGLCTIFAGALLSALPQAQSQGLQGQQPPRYTTLSGPNAAQRWMLVQERSSVVYGNRAVGQKPIPLTHYNLQLSFDPTKLEQSHIILTADVSSMFLPAKSVNVPLLEYLEPSTQVAQGPTRATFMSNKITRKNSHEFIAEGGLRIGEKSKPISIPFTVKLDRDVPGGMMIILQGGFTANRADFATENYSSTGQGDVPVRFELAAVPLK